MGRCKTFTRQGRCKEQAEPGHAHCDQHYQNWKTRRAETATFQKCACGNVLGLSALAQGLDKCPPCINRSLADDRQE